MDIYTQLIICNSLMSLYNNSKEKEVVVIVKKKKLYNLTNSSDEPNENCSFILEKPQLNYNVKNVKEFIEKNIKVFYKEIKKQLKNYNGTRFKQIN